MEEKTTKYDMAQFPIDIVADILSRLPVEPILRFRCVSKPWCALIDSSHFVKLHLKTSIDTKSNRQIILTNNEHTSLYWVSMYSLDVAVQLDLPPVINDCRNKCGLLDVFGSCHGLVLLRGTKDQVLVWNPSTRNYRILPSVITTSTDDDIKTPNRSLLKNEFYGLGHDAVHNDYKVLKIIQFYPWKGVSSTLSQVQVYSLKTNSWSKIIADFPYYLYRGEYRGVLANGALHWAASEIDNGDYPFVVAFDLTTMDYRLVPSFDDTEKICLSMEVASLEGCLCIWRKYRYYPYDVWVMKDYGIKESWTKLLSLPLPTDLISFLYLVPIALSVDGTKVLLLLNRKELVWYDLQNQIVTTVNLRGLANTSCAEFCMQSLVPLAGDDTTTGKKQHKEENEDREPKRDGKNRVGFLLEGSSSRSRHV